MGISSDEGRAGTETEIRRTGESERPVPPLPRFSVSPFPVRLAAVLAASVLVGADRGGCGNCCESEKGADPVAAKKSGDPLMECGTKPDAKAVAGATGEAKVVKSEEEWRKNLTPEQFAVLRKKGTERPFQGPYWDFHEKDGTFRCAGCGNVLFTADAKFDSGTGWPSFSSPAVKEAVKTHTDTSHGMTRTEVVCAKCDGHLGHVFDDGPGPNGLRYCINGTALRLEKTAEGNPKSQNPNPK